MSQSSLAMLADVSPTRGERTKAWARRNTGWLLMAPALLVMLGMGIFPLLYSIGISFLRWEPKVPGRPFVWFHNYGQVLINSEFWVSLRTTAIIVVSGIVLEFFLGLALALALMGTTKGRRVLMPILMLPVMMVPVVVGFTWRMLWDPSYGPINQALGWFAGRVVVIDWLSTPTTAFVAIIVTEMWQWTPFMFLILLAGLTSVNPELQEAAGMDGASAWQTFWRITLPVLRPVILVAVLIRTLDLIKLFDIVYVTTGGGPGYATQPISFFLYRTGARFFRMGFTAAGAWVFLVIVSVIISLSVRRVGED